MLNQSYLNRKRHDSWQHTEVDVSELHQYDNSHQHAHNMTTNWWGFRTWYRVCVRHCSHKREAKYCAWQKFGQSVEMKKAPIVNLCTHQCSISHQRNDNNSNGFTLTFYIGLRVIGKKSTIFANLPLLLQAHTAQNLMREVFILRFNKCTGKTIWYQNKISTTPTPKAWGWS